LQINESFIDNDIHGICFISPKVAKNEVEACSARINTVVLHFNDGLKEVMLK